MEPDWHRPPLAGQEKARVFFALWPDETLRSGLYRAAVDGARRFGGRAMGRETLHLTLAFIGDVPVEALPMLQAAANSVAAKAFSLTIDQLGFWTHNRILWAGSCRQEPALGQLVEDLSGRLKAAGYSTGIRSGRSFAPHLTLVRKVTEPKPRLPDLPPLPWDCRRFVLVRSRLSAKGSSYEIIGEWPLQPEA